MAHHKVSMGLAIVLVTMLWPHVASQSNDCTSEIISMSPCLNFISGNSSTPSVACCSQLRNVVGSQPRCLCQVLNGGGSNMGLNINQTQALALPKACNVQTPSFSIKDISSMQSRGRIKSGAITRRWFFKCSFTKPAGS